MRRIEEVVSIRKRKKKSRGGTTYRCGGRETIKNTYQKFLTGDE